MVAPDKRDQRHENKTLLAPKDIYDKSEFSGERGSFGQSLVDLAWEDTLRGIYFPADAKPHYIDNAVWDAFLDWAVRHPLDDLLDQGIVEPDGRPFVSSPSDAVLEAANSVRRSRFELQRLAAVIRYSLAPTLRLWEDGGTATAEQQADFLLGPLSEHAPRPKPLAALTQFGTRLWRLLETQADSDRDSGYWKTVRGFGDFFIRAKGRDTLALASHAYILLIKAQAPFAQDPEAAKLVAGAANNLVSLLDDLAGKSPSVTVLQAMFSAGLLRVRAADVAEGRHGLKRGSRRGGVLDDLGNTPTLFQAVPGDSHKRRHLRQAWFCARTGAERAVRRRPGEEDARDVASAFFNAGVALLTGGYRRQSEAVTARIVLNALGFWWAAHLAGDDEARALGDYNGGDCAVNLLGAMTDMDVTVLDRFRQRTLQSLWAALVSRRSLLESSDFKRMEASARKMQLESPSGLTPASSSLRAAASAFLAEAGTLRGMKLLTQIPDEAEIFVVENNRRRAACLSWRAAVRALRPLVIKDGESVSKLLEPVWKQINQPATYPDELAEKIEEWLRSSSGTTPVVSAGLMSADELHRLLSGGRDGPPLGEWLDANARELAGALARDGK